eukprot:76947-Chlamydomonas_euryale.AAC.1
MFLLLSRYPSLLTPCRTRRPRTTASGCLAPACWSSRSAGCMCRTSRPASSTSCPTLTRATAWRWCRARSWRRRGCRRPRRCCLWRGRPRATPRRGPRPRPPACCSCEPEPCCRGREHAAGVSLGVAGRLRVKLWILSLRAALRARVQDCQLAAAVRRRLAAHAQTLLQV